MELRHLEQPPSLLVIGAREHTLDKLNKMAIHYILIQAANDRLAEFVDERVIFINNYQDIQEIIQIATQLHQANHFTAVVSFTEFGLYPAALLAEQWSIPGNSVNAVQKTRDKSAMRSLMNLHQLSSVAFQCCANLEELVFFYKKINSPLIIKPIDGAGSEGVYYVDSFHTLSKAWEWITQQGYQKVIAEEYLLGREYSVESLTLDGVHEVIAITEKLTTQHPHFIELGHCSPAVLHKELELDIHDLIKSFLDLIQHQNGPAHTEIKIHQNELKIIESQTRMGGDQIWELTELTTGVDVISETIIHLLGLKQSRRQKKANAAAILFFARECEEILNIEGWEEVQSTPGILRLKCDLEVGQKLGKLKSSRSRQGYILGIASEPKEAHILVNSAMQKLRISALSLNV